MTQHLRQFKARYLVVQRGYGYPILYPISGNYCKCQI